MAQRPNFREWCEPRLSLFYTNWVSNPSPSPQSGSVRIAFLEGSRSRLEPAEAFLRKRGVEVFRSKNLKEILVYLIKARPLGVFLSIEHNHPKVQSLPKIIGPLLGIKAVFYCDSQSSQVVDQLSVLTHPLKLFPPVGGPAVERMIFRLGQIEKEEPSGPARGSLGAGALGDSAVHLQGQKFDNNQQINSVLSQLFGEDIRIEGEMAPTGPVRIASEGSAFAPQVATDETALARGADSALRESVRNVEGVSPEAVEKIGVTSNLACITVSSPKYSGYLVCALPKGKEIDAQMIERIRVRLADFMRKQGEHVGDEKAIQLTVTPVPFELWALSKAEFMKKSIHQGAEISIAFFPKIDVQPKYEVAPDEKMVCISIDEIRVDVPLEFDLYLYLPKNEKYVMYMREKSTFGEDHHKRLRSKDVTRVYLRKDSMDNLKKYQAQNFLNDKIDEFSKTNASE